MGSVRGAAVGPRRVTDKAGRDRLGEEGSDRKPGKAREKLGGLRQDERRRAERHEDQRAAGVGARAKWFGETPAERDREDRRQKTR